MFDISLLSNIMYPSQNFWEFNLYFKAKGPCAITLCVYIWKIGDFSDACQTFSLVWKVIGRFFGPTDITRGSASGGGRGKKTKCVLIQSSVLLRASWKDEEETDLESEWGIIKQKRAVAFLEAEKIKSHFRGT